MWGDFYFQLSRTCLEIDRLQAIEFRKKWLQVRMAQDGV
jgi:hypothetical protein